MHEANRKYWDAAASSWDEMSDVDWRRCLEEPSVAFEGDALSMINRFVGNLDGRQVCIIGSGDNYAAFALAGLGAKVTSTDISERRLETAVRRADTLGLRIKFIRCDAAEMIPVPDSGFDLVCSTNGFFVWVADLSAVYSAVHRILRPCGYYICYDVHPFLRPWKDQRRIEPAKSYFQTGPFESGENGSFTYEFHWTVSDIINALLRSGLVLRRVVEASAENSRFWQGSSYGRGTDDSLLDWRSNPRAALPAWLTVVAQKPAA